jgi:DNA-binding beta-propeller fold protein YncE
MKTFDCPKCGAPVNYEPNALASGTARCSYCQSQLALPDELRGKPAYIISQIDINVGPHVKAAASKAIWFLVLIPIFVVIIVIAGVFGALTPKIRSVSNSKSPVVGPSGPSGSRTNDPANSFARVVLTFGSEGIGPGMMTGARSIAVDAAGRIYVGEYSSGRVQVFDPAGQFITQWMVDPKMALRGMAVDRQGTVYIAQRGTITRYEGSTGKSLGQIEYSEGIGFNDLVATPDGGLVCSWHLNRDDIVRFNAQGEAVSIIRKAISTVADRPELDTSVAVDGLGNIYALGSFTNGIFKFSANGKFLNRFGGPGNQPGQISASHAIAVDGKGRVFVSDTKGVQVFDSDGRYLTVFKPGGVAFGMTFNDKNELFIAAHNKVIKFVLNQ